MLGAGLEQSKIPTLINGSGGSPAYSGIVDDLGGVAATGFVLGYSDKRTTVDHTGNCIKVRRASDNATQDIGFDASGDIDSAAVSTFCGSSDGFVDTIYQQYGSGNDAVQTTLASQPKIYDGATTTFYSDGMDFDGSDDYMVITPYAAIDFNDPTQSVYINFKGTAGYIYCKNTDASTNVQYGVYVLSTLLYTYYEGSNLYSYAHNSAIQNKLLYNWQDKNADGLKVNLTGTESTKTVNTSLTSRTYFTIGARKSPTGYLVYYNGTLKTLLIFNTNQYSNYTDIAAAV